MLNKEEQHILTYETYKKNFGFLMKAFLMKKMEKIIIKIVTD